MMVRLFPQGLGADSLFEDPDFPADRYYFSGVTGCQRRGRGGGAQGAKSGGEAVLLQFSDFTKDTMHNFNRLFC